MNETRRAVVEALADGPATGPDLAESLDVSRAAVWKHVEALREHGFDIESGSDGYTLADVEGYTGSTIEYGLEAQFSIEYHDSIESTNERARQLASDEGASESGAGGDDPSRDVVVVADEQTGSKGRLERSWSSPPGGVWLSVLQRPSIPPARAPLYTLAASVATGRAAREAGVDARIKWPNDVVVPADTDRGYRKLAGILTEMEGETDRIGWLVVGIGVNANVDADGLPDGATSVRDEAGDVDRRPFVQRLLEEFDALREDLDAVVPAWRELALTLGQRVRVDRPQGAVEGLAVDVTDTGALVVESDDGDRTTVTAGDCEHLRPT